MEPEQFEQIKRVMYNDLKNVINMFSESENNKQVYAAVVDLDPDNGTLVFGFDTEDGFRETVAANEHYRAYTDRELYGFRGLKYSVGDFAFRFYDDHFSAELNAFLSSYAEYVQGLDYDDEQTYLDAQGLLISTVIDVIRRLELDIQRLDRTSLFIYFVTLHDIGYDTMIDLMKHTIHAELFNDVFPEIRAVEQFKENIQSLDFPGQIEFWLNIYLEFRLGINSEVSEQLKSYAQNEFDAKDEMIKLGIVAIPFILNQIERILANRSNAHLNVYDQTQDQQLLLDLIMVIKSITLEHQAPVINEMLLEHMRSLFIQIAVQTESNLIRYHMVDILSLISPETDPKPNDEIDLRSFFTKMIN